MEQVATRIYVDETKAKGYVLVAGVMLPADTAQIRQVVRGLVAPGQRRVHMKSEKTPRQHQIVSALLRLELRAVIYEADGQRYRTDIDRRRACLAQLVADNAHTCERLVLESDASQDARDRQALVELTREHGCRGTLTYEHATAAVEPLLAIPDVVAWSWARGGDWRRRIAPLVDRVVRV